MGCMADSIARVRAAMTSGEGQQLELVVIRPLAFCTMDEECQAEADEHAGDCPVELELRETFGF
jgi:hypothetical protein